jgi:hypothetical protein
MTGTPVFIDREHPSRGVAFANRVDPGQQASSQMLRPYATPRALSQYVVLQLRLARSKIDKARGVYKQKVPVLIA